MPRIPPSPLKSALLNTPEVEVWPASLLRARWAVERGDDYPHMTVRTTPNV